MTIEATYTPIGRRKVKAIPARCSKGQALFREWMQAIKAAPTWQESGFIFLGVRKYDKHLQKCETCKCYEFYRISERRKIK